MEPADGDGVFVADLAAERARLGKANVMRLARPHTTQGCEARNLQCSLSRRRMVLAATRRRRVPAGPGGRIGAPAASSIGVAKGFSTGELDSSSRADCLSPGRPADVESIVASFSRK